MTTLTSSGFQMVTGNIQRLSITTPEGLVYDPDYDVLYVCEFVSFFWLLINPLGANPTKCSNTTLSSNSSIRVAELFECVWQFCRVGA